jgi:Putative Zn-dependent protease, contains TPR repeats
MMKRYLLLIAVVFIIDSCSKVPITGRRQLDLVPESQVISLSFDGYQKVLKDNKLSTNMEQTRMVKNVGIHIQGAVETYMAQHNLKDRLSGFKWEFNLLESPTVNAFCMPGGKVAFYTGIMPICKDEIGIAVVMGHEVAHAIANHGGERMSQGLVQQMGGVAIAVALKDKPETTQQLALSAYGVGSNVFGMLPYSRLHESEADRLGLIFMAMAGYDPREAPKFWERMSSMSKGQKPAEFLSTHPSDATRISDLNKEMNEALKYYKAK